jgi:hypothetical protein
MDRDYVDQAQRDRARRRADELLAESEAAAPWRHFEHGSVRDYRFVLGQLALSLPRAHIPGNELVEALALVCATRRVLREIESERRRWLAYSYTPYLPFDLGGLLRASESFAIRLLQAVVAAEGLDIAARLDAAEALAETGNLEAVRYVLAALKRSRLLALFSRGLADALTSGHAAFHPDDVDVRKEYTQGLKELFAPLLRARDAAVRTVARRFLERFPKFKGQPAPRPASRLSTWLSWREKRATRALERLERAYKQFADRRDRASWDDYIRAFRSVERYSHTNAVQTFFERHDLVPL